MRRMAGGSQSDQIAGIPLEMRETLVEWNRDALLILSCASCVVRSDVRTLTINRRTRGGPVPVM